MRLPRHSTVVAYLALFVSISTGGAFAATHLAPNSVGSTQIRSESVKYSDIDRSVWDKFLAELTDDTPETDNCDDPDLVGRDREEAGCP